jgi:predicted ATPase
MEPVQLHPDMARILATLFESRTKRAQAAGEANADVQAYVGQCFKILELDESEYHFDESRFMFIPIPKESNGQES